MEPKHSKYKPSQKNWSKWLLIVLLLAGGGTAFWQLFHGSETEVVSNAQEIPSRPVTTTTLTQGTPVKTITVLGQVVASDSATIRTQIDGIVEQVLVKVGDRVSEGMTVAVLEDTDQRLAVLQAQANLAQEQSNLSRLEIGTRPEIIAQRQAEVKTAKAREKEAQDNLKRLRSLQEEGALSERELIQAQTEADAAYSERLRTEAILAEALAGPRKEEIAAQQGRVAAARVALEQAQVELARTNIKSNLSGVVQSREVSLGDYVESSDALISIVSKEELDIFLEIPEQLSAQIEPGLSVELRARALPNWRQTGKIIALLPVTNTTSRRQLVRVNLPNPPADLRPGMGIQGEVKLPIETNTTTFIVPRDALSRRRDEWLLFTVENGVTQEFTVTMVEDMGETVAINHPDLQAGQTIVFSGSDGLSDGTHVRVINTEDN